jgi:predicted amidophosphoribosyltransferase
VRQTGDLRLTDAGIFILRRTPGWRRTDHEQGAFISPRFTCPSCGESFLSDPGEAACPKCGNSGVRPVPGERFSEHEPSDPLLAAEALNENLRRLKATLKER